ncbi:MAG: hypothetical protein RLZZ272_1312 [Actinomycetota bacterium]
MSAMPHPASTPLRALGAAPAGVTVRDHRIPDERPILRVVPPARPSRAVFLVRRLLVVGILVLAALVGAAVAGQGAGADLVDPVDGHVVLAPGETLWDVAVATAPDGVDARAQLARLRELNGFGGGALAPWTVVLLPAR